MPVKQARLMVGTPPSSVHGNSGGIYCCHCKVTDHRSEVTFRRWHGPGKCHGGMGAGPSQSSQQQQQQQNQELGPQQEHQQHGEPVPIEAQDGVEATAAEPPSPALSSPFGAGGGGDFEEDLQQLLVGWDSPPAQLALPPAPLQTSMHTYQCTFCYVSTRGLPDSS